MIFGGPIQLFQTGVTEEKIVGSTVPSAVVKLLLTEMLEPGTKVPDIVPFAHDEPSVKAQSVYMLELAVEVITAATEEPEKLFPVTVTVPLPTSPQLLFSYYSLELSRRLK